MPAKNLRGKAGLDSRDHVFVADFKKDLHTSKGRGLVPPGHIALSRFERTDMRIYQNKNSLAILLVSPCNLFIKQALCQLWYSIAIIQ